MTDAAIAIPPMAFRTTSAADLSRRMRQGEVSVREVIRLTLDRAHAVQAALNPFTLILEADALAAADRADSARTAGADLPPLWGLPVAIKDLTPMAGHPWTAGSRAFADRIAAEDAVVVQRLRAAGAIVVARTTTPEFACSGFTHNALHGITRNPHDPAQTPGGSSGGSGVAVATGVVPFAEGSDMGGSIRIPAAWCGVTGLKPSFGRIPIGFLPSRFDTISHLGPLARSCADARLFLRHTAGPHPADPFSLPGPWVEGDPVRLDGLRLAASPDLGYVALDPTVRQGFADALTRLGDVGAVVEDVDLGWTPAVHDAWGLQWNVTFATWYGDLDPRAPDPAMNAMIAEGRRATATDLMRVEAVRTAVWADLARLFTRFDALLTPTMAVPPPPAADNDADHWRHLPDGRLYTVDLTCPFNLTSPCPVLSIPMGSANGLPLGLQIVTPPHTDDRALRIGEAMEAALVG